MRVLDGAYKDCRRDKGVNIFDTAYNKRSVHHISEIWGIIVIVGILGLGAVTRYNYWENLPRGLGNSQLMQQPNSFIAERAWKDLKILTSFGPRPTGAYSNEVLAVDFLRREISYIKQMANRNQRIELDVQVVSGAFWVDFKPHGMTTAYRNVQNVVVKLHGESSTQGNHSLLINCHFDSVPGSPGASDDAGSCVVMLEILRVLSRGSMLNKHSIIFLFNGAEEVGLKASHGFITQHKWAKDVRSFINLESAGSGGKEILFQTGPNTPWLVKMYGRAIQYPNAQSAAEEVFHSGLIPSDTDFRIFRDFGKIPGLDFAHVINGYRYHTKYDHIDYVSRSVLQHTGDNVLELTKFIVNWEELGNADKLPQGAEIFFDILGFTFISYSMDFANIFNYVVVTLAVLLPYLFLSRATRGINKKHLRFEIFLGFLINVISFVGGLAICYAIAYDLDLMGKSMAWYSNTFLCVPTYCLATVFFQCIVHLVLSRNIKAPLSLALQTQARLTGTSMFWGLLAAALTGAGIRTAYVLIVPLLITLFTNLAIGFLGYQNTIRRWLYVHLGGQIFVIIWATHFYHMVVSMFIPTAGRSGGHKNPDIMIAMICGSLTFFATSYVTPLVILLKRCKSLLISLFAVYVITRFYFISFTHYGFPYRDDRGGAPAVQRHYITHTVRTLYDKDGNIRYTDSGFWMSDMDRNCRKTVESLSMPETPIPHEFNILCKNEIFCGLPFLTSRQLHLGGYWVPAPTPLIREVATLKLISKEKISPKIHRLNFLLIGSYQLSLHIRPKDSVTLDRWNLMDYVPEPTVYNKQKAHFVMISHGIESAPMNITLDFKTTSDNHERPLVDISLVTLHSEYHKEHTPAFAHILAKLPRWAYAVPSVASLVSWTF
ncbi:endoplasmic reticulum metallopeptidase 1-like [Eupeodes corollae]|uniref:endoplasmic reticulum metallopeptidase 1-like n=1 Tax=Eupeodes corollae TaxID=290404 RepID=UPI002490277E|nr:endoplasmic reticulum metallopeptidase 1-like [Eupeodes corollae]